MTLDEAKELLAGRPELMTTDEVAEVCRVHPRTVRQWYADERIEVIRFSGRRIVVARDEVARLLVRSSERGGVRAIS